jgi:hypothetical protein
MIKGSAFNESPQFMRGTHKASNSCRMLVSSGYCCLLAVIPKSCLAKPEKDRIARLPVVSRPLLMAWLYTFCGVFLELPEDVYGNPASLFVARFTGLAGELPVRVTGHGDGTLAVTTTAGRLPALPAAAQWAMRGSAPRSGDEAAGIRLAPGGLPRVSGRSGRRPERQPSRSAALFARNVGRAARAGA